MRIVVDAMGTDDHPSADVGGAVQAAKETHHSIILVGDEKSIRKELINHAQTQNLNIEIVHAQDYIAMSDKPSLVAKEKPQSSLHVGMELVKTGQADAIVTAGNTGAAHAIAMLYKLKRIRNVKRPALSVIFNINGKPLIIIDAGANADSKPEWIAQFGVMGSIYAEKVLKIHNPRVGLLSNGEEEGKGNQLTVSSTEMMHHYPLNFVGNIEPINLMNNEVDVIVSDGFVGNILIKTFEATTRYLGNIIRDELRKNPISSLGGFLIKPAMQRVRKKVDTSEIGGAPLLGVNGIVIISHGSSDSYAIKNAINQAAIAAQANVITAIEKGLSEINVASDKTQD